MKILKNCLRIFRRGGAPILGAHAVLVMLVGGYLAICKPVIGGSGSSSGRTVSNGTTVLGEKCGAGGDFAVVVGGAAVLFGGFLFRVAYEVSK